MDEQQGQGKRSVEDILKDWGFDLEAFEARTRKAASDAKDEYGEVLGGLREKLVETKVRLEEVRKASRPASAELRAGLERALRELGQAFDRAAERIREKREQENQPPDDGQAGD